MVLYMALLVNAINLVLTKSFCEVDFQKKLKPLFSFRLNEQKTKTIKSSLKKSTLRWLFLPKLSANQTGDT